LKLYVGPDITGIGWVCVCHILCGYIQIFIFRSFYYLFVFWLYAVDGLSAF